MSNLYSNDRRNYYSIVFEIKSMARLNLIKRARRPPSLASAFAGVEINQRHSSDASRRPTVAVSGPAPPNPASAKVDQPRSPELLSIFNKKILSIGSIKNARRMPEPLWAAEQRPGGV